ncbi:hypothetical protein EI94DRAFT_1733163, partial [Lactarius quietus]
MPWNRALSTCTPCRPPGIVRTCRPPGHREASIYSGYEQSRVCWCPTSVLCSLFSHAAGPIESAGGGGKRYFSDV